MASLRPDPVCYQSTRRLLSLHEVQSITSLSRAQVLRMSALGTFPKPRHLSARRIAWFSDEVDAWVDGCAVKPGIAE